MTLAVYLASVVGMQRAAGVRAELSAAGGWTPEEWEVVGSHLQWSAAALALAMAALWSPRFLSVGSPRRAIPTAGMVPAMATLLGMGAVLQWGYLWTEPTEIAAHGWKYCQFAGLGGLLLIFFALALKMRPPLGWGSPAPKWLRALFAVAVVLPLVALMAAGSGPGDTRINLGPIQPIELVKLAFVGLLASTADRLNAWQTHPLGSVKWGRFLFQRRRLGLPPASLLLLCLSVLAIALLLLELVGDLGPTLVLALIFVMWFGVVTQAPREIFLLLAALCIPIYLMVTYSDLDPFLARRIAMWREPFDNGLQMGDQTARGLWAVAAGGWGGRGVAQAHPGALPAGYTDLIVAHLMETWGIAGWLVHVLAMWWLVRGGLRVSSRQGSRFGALLALGLTCLLFAQWAVIVAGTFGLLPLTGIVVPVLSQGGTGMVTFTLVIGALLLLARLGERLNDGEKALVRHEQAVGHLQWVVAALFLLFAAAGVRHGAARGVSARPILTMQEDTSLVLRYDPRLVQLARRVRRGAILDRAGQPLADTAADGSRVYPVGAAAGTLMGVPGRGIMSEPWWAEAAFQEQLRGGSLAEGRAVWVGTAIPTEEQRKKLKIGEDRRFIVTGILGHGDGPRPPGDEVRRHRLSTRDYRHLTPFLHMPGGIRNPAFIAYADDVAARSVRLTLARDLQVAAHRALERHAGRVGSPMAAAVVTDVTTGEVLARAQWPDFDPGAPEVLVARRKGDPRFMGSYGPWVDKTAPSRAFAGLQAGSVFKLYTGLAWALDGRARGSGCDATSATTLRCTIPPGDERPGFSRPHWRGVIHDGHARPDGTLSMREALARSCNVYFGQLGLEVGPEPFQRLAASGLTVGGRSRWSPGSADSFRLASTAYGQGTARLTVMEAARLASTIANDGVLRRCSVNMELGGTCVDRRVVDNGGAVAALKSGMRAVVRPGGTAQRFNTPPGVRAYGKTGTADDPRRRDERPYGVRGATPHSWFIGFAEPDEGEACESASGGLAFAVTVARGGAGAGAAASVAEELLRAAVQQGYLR